MMSRGRKPVRSYDKKAYSNEHERFLYFYINWVGVPFCYEVGMYGLLASV